MSAPDNAGWGDWSARTRRTSRPADRLPGMSDAVERIREGVERERKRFEMPGCALVVVTLGEAPLTPG